MRIELPVFHDFIRILGMFLGRRPFLGPKVAMIDITNNCDLDCLMCGYHSLLLKKGQDYQAWKSGMMSYDILASLLSDLSKMKTEVLTICGSGEPFLHPDIKKILPLLVQYKFKTQVMTNGIHIGKKMIEELIEMPLPRLTFSIHAGDNKTYNSVHPLCGEELFCTLKENMIYLNMRKKALRHKYPQVSIINVISRLNYDNLVPMVEFAQEVGAQRIWFKPLIIVEETRERLSLREEDISRIRADLKFLRKKIKLEHNIDEFLDSLVHWRDIQVDKSCRWGRNRLCHLPWMLANITTEGEVLGCLYQGSNSFGNIKRQPFRIIWNSKEYGEFRENKLCPEYCLGAATYPFVNIVGSINRIKNRVSLEFCRHKKQNIASFAIHKAGTVKRFLK